MTTDERAPDIDWDLIGLYFGDHVSGATAGINRVAFMAKEHKDTPYAAKLKQIERELREERALYYKLIERLDLPRRKLRQELAWVGERLGRLKLNGRVLSRSPMTPLLEAELMRAAIMGKIGGWQVLATYREELSLTQATVDGLIAQAHRQIDDLSEMHEHFRAEAFRRKS